MDLGIDTLIGILAFLVLLGEASFGAMICINIFCDEWGLFLKVEMICAVVISILTVISWTTYFMVEKLF
ncbi:hypothetical protein VNN36_09980 [Lactococcus garvieae]|uniref:hypothetical protein n=1 Tax=Lactococcus garvieae TaxID=1363 RepID=UPI0030D31500